MAYRILSKFIALSALISFSFFIASCDKDEESTNRSTPSVQSSQLVGTWQRVATASVQPGSAAVCSLKTVLAQMSIDANLNWSYSESNQPLNTNGSSGSVPIREQRYGTSYIRFRSSPNVYTIKFLSDFPGTPFRNGESARMDVFLDGSVMRTVWTGLSFPYATCADMWVKTSNTSSNGVAGIVRTGQGFGLSNLPIVIQRGATIDSGVTTDRFGFFAVGSNSAGYAWVSARRNGSVRSAGTYSNLSNNAQITEIGFDVGTIIGMITPTNSRYAYATPTITVQPTNRTFSADQNGICELSSLAPGIYTLTASFFGFENATLQDTVADNATSTVSFALSPLPTGSLIGYVTDSSTGSPLSDVQFSLHEPASGNATSDNAGHFLLNLLPVGHYLITTYTYSYNTYQGINFEFTISENQTTDITIPVNLGYGTMAGRVFDQISEEPADSVTLTLDALPDTVRTDGNGNFTFTHIPAGRHVLHFSKDNYFSDSTQVYVSSNGSSSYSYYIRPIPCTVSQTITGHTNLVSSVAYSHSGEIYASGSYDATIKLWSAADNSLIRTLSDSSIEITTIAFSPNDSLLACGTWDGRVDIWRISDGVRIQSLTGHESRVTSVAFNPNGSLLASCELNNVILIRRTEDWSVRNTISNQNSQELYSLAFSPDGNYLACSGSLVTIWRVTDGSLFATNNNYYNGHTTVKYSPSGAMLVATNGYQIVIYRASDLSQLKNFYTQDYSQINAVSVSPNGRYLTVATNNGKLYVWTLDGDFVGAMPSDSEYLTSLAFSPNGHVIITGSANNSVLVWRFNLR